MNAVLQVVWKTVVLTGKGKHRKRVVHMQVLYRAVGGGTADKHGQFIGRLRITYKPARVVQARLTLQVGAGRSTTVKTAWVTIDPLRHQHKGRATPLQKHK